MGKKKSADKAPNISKLLESWTDEEVLLNLAPFFDRVSIGVDFMEDPEDSNLLTHQVLAIVCGEKVIASEMKELDWPLMRMPIPEAFKGVLN